MTTCEPMQACETRDIYPVPPAVPAEHLFAILNKRHPGLGGNLRVHADGEHVSSVIVFNFRPAKRAAISKVHAYKFVCRRNIWHSRTF